MIFPELPRTTHFVKVDIIDPPSQTEPPVQSITADQWFEQHFPQQPRPQHQDHTISPAQATRERIEFALICIFMIVWAVYWHQFQ